MYSGTLFTQFELPCIVEIHCILSESELIGKVGSTLLRQWQQQHVQAQLVVEHMGVLLHISGRQEGNAVCWCRQRHRAVVRDQRARQQRREAAEKLQHAQVHDSSLINISACIGGMQYITCCMIYNSHPAELHAGHSLTSWLTICQQDCCSCRSTAVPALILSLCQCIPQQGVIC